MNFDSLKDISVSVYTYLDLFSLGAKRPHVSHGLSRYYYDGSLAGISCFYAIFKKSLKSGCSIGAIISIVNSMIICAEKQLNSMCTKASGECYEAVLDYQRGWINAGKILQVILEVEK